MITSQPSSKTVPEELDLQLGSKVYHDFTNHGCLHCGIVKALAGF